MTRTSFDIHISDVNAFDQCRRAWDYSSPLRKSLRPLGPYSPFLVGSAVHHCLEWWYKGEIPVEQSLAEFADQELAPLKASPLWSAYQARVSEDLELARGLVKHYQVWQRFDKTIWADRNFEFIQPEKDFRVPLFHNTKKRIWLAGRFDGVVKHTPTGKYYLWEIKTTRSIAERAKALDFDPQTMAYALAAQEATGVEIEGIIYTLLAKKLPQTPEPLKSGDRLSKAIKSGAGFNTTAHWYLQSCLEFHEGAPNLSGLIKDLYNDPMAQLLTGGNSFQSRLVVSPTQQELMRFKEELITKARAMISPATVIYSSPNHHCNYCSFRAPCLALNRGGLGAEAISLAQGFHKNPRFEGNEND